MKQPMGNALWSDCETDEERAWFFRSGRAHNNCLIVDYLAVPCAKAFEDAAKWRAANTAKIETSDVDLIAVMLHALRAVDAYYRSPGEDDWVRFHNDALVPVRQAILWAETAAKPIQPWGLDAVPLMVCPGVNMSCPKTCSHAKPHAGEELCSLEMPSTCPACVQIGWRERSKK